jgi:hypothetical protein
MRNKFLLFLVVILVGIAGFATTSALASKPPHHQVTLCHATHSQKNPYVSITVDVASAGVASDLHGHRGHSADIIPSFEYDGVTYSAQGDQSILANGCNVTETTTTPVTTSTSTTTTVETTATTPSTSSSTSTTVPTTSTGTTTTTPAPSTTTSPTPPTKPELQKELQKQVKQKGTGRVDNTPTAAGSLPHTGLSLWYAVVLGIGLLTSGVAIRKRV